MSIIEHPGRRPRRGMARRLLTGIRMGLGLRGAALAWMVSSALPAAQRRATFHVGAIVQPSARVSAEIGVLPGTARMSLAGNAAAPAVQVGQGPLRVVRGREVQL